MIKHIIQGVLLVGSLVAVGLLTEGYVVAGSLVGLATQPAWLYTTWTNKQWGIFVLSLCYSLMYLNGAMK